MNQIQRETQWAKVATLSFMVLHLSLSCFTLWKNYIFNAYLEAPEVPRNFQAIERSDEISIYVGGGFIVLLILLMCVNGRWIYVASKNAAQLRPREGRIKPGWAVGWYLIPLANLFMPYRAMKETWIDTVGVVQSTKDDVPKWFALWWASWIIMSIVDRVLGRLPDAITPEEYLTQNYIIAGMGPFWLVPAYFFYRIISEVGQAYRGQEEIFA